ncbi:ribonuclease H-like domain-containing protein [Tanacetum coccineum]
MGFVDGTCVRHATSLVISQQWERCNDIVLGWILGSLSPEMYLGQVYSKIASDVTEKLQETYDKIDGYVIFNVIHKIHSLKQGELGFKTQLVIRLMQFLMGLNDVYQPIMSNILARDPLPDVKDAFNVVSKEESYRELHHRSGFGPGSIVQHDTFVVKSNNFKGNDFKKGTNIANMGPNPNMGNSNGRAFNGSGEVHMGVSTSSGSTTFDTSFTKEQMMKILSLINEKPFGSANANMAGMRPTFFNENFLNLTVGHPNGTLFKITDFRNLRLTTNVVLFDVLVVPEYYDLNLVKNVGTGNESGGLYLFDVEQYGKPNDDERDSSNGKGNVMGSSNLNSPHPVIDEATFATHIDDNNNIFEGSQTKNNGFGSGIEFQNNKNNGDEPQTARKSNRSETKVFKLVKYLWGRKQALRQWNEKLTNALKENDFNQGINEYSLFVKNDNGIFLALLGYVDDIVVYHGNSLGLLGFSDADWANKKRATLSKSSVEAEHRCMSSTNCEIIWVIHLLKDLNVEGLLLVPLDCDITSAIQIDVNLVFYEKTKHYEIDVHLVKEKVASGIISTVKVC